MNRPTSLGANLAGQANFVVKPYDPLDDAIQRFNEFNNTPPDQREYTEAELIKLIIHQVRQADA